MLSLSTERMAAGGRDASAQNRERSIPTCDVIVWATRPLTYAVLMSGILRGLRVTPSMLSAVGDAFCRRVFPIHTFPPSLSLWRRRGGHRGLRKGTGKPSRRAGSMYTASPRVTSYAFGATPPW